MSAPDRNGAVDFKTALRHDGNRKRNVPDVVEKTRPDTQHAIGGL